jgi:hypothetical protein
MMLKTMMQSVEKTTTPWIIGRSKLPSACTASRPRPGRPKIVSVKMAPPSCDADVHPEHRHDRQQRVAEHVAAHHLLLRRSLRPRRCGRSPHRGCPSRWRGSSARRSLRRGGRR